MDDIAWTDPVAADTPARVIQTPDEAIAGEGFTLIEAGLIQSLMGSPRGSAFPSAPTQREDIRLHQPLTKRAWEKPPTDRKVSRGSDPAGEPSAPGPNQAMGGADSPKAQEEDGSRCASPAVARDAGLPQMSATSEQPAGAETRSFGISLTEEEMKLVLGAIDRAPFQGLATARLLTDLMGKFTAALQPRNGEEHPATAPAEEVGDAGNSDAKGGGG